MFERYTEKARRVIFFARYEASQFGSPYIESEHLLLGILREDKALTHRFLSGDGAVESIRRQIEAHTVIHEKVSTSVDLPLSNECKRVLAYAAEEAERLAHKHIGTEHLFLGLLRENKCFAAELLTERGVNLVQVREAVNAGDAGPGLHTQAPPPRVPRTPVKIRFINASTSEQLFECDHSPADPIPVIGQSIALRGRDESSAPATLLRVENITFVYQRQPAEPSDLVETRKRLEFIIQRVENSIANHEFEKARFYSEEERNERDNLRALQERYRKEESPENTGSPVTGRLREILIAVAAA